MVFAGKEWFALHHLGKDTASTPNIDFDIVFLPGKHDFGGTIVPCRYVARHLWILQASESKVTDFEITILVHKDVGGLEISMHDASRVNVFKPSLNRVSLPDTSEIHPEWDLQEFDRESTE